MEKKNFRVSEQTTDWANLYRELWSLQGKVHKQLEELFVEPESEFQDHFMDGFLKLFRDSLEIVLKNIIN